MIMTRFRPLILACVAVGWILAHRVVLGEEPQTCGWHSDTSLNIGGWQVIDFGDGVIRRQKYNELGFPEIENFDDEAVAVADDEHGNAIIAGSSNGRPALARLLPNGNLDPTFGPNGRVVWQPRFPARASSVAAILPLTEGYLLAAEVAYSFYSSGTDVLIRKIDRLGKLDDSFGSSGALALRPNFFVKKVAFDRARRAVVLLGSDDKGIVIARFDIDSGVADSTFGDKGRLVLSMPGQPLVRDLRITADDEILVVGYREEQLDASTRVTNFLIRLRSDGAPLSRFGVPGSPPLLTEKGRWYAASVAARKGGGLTVVFDGEAVIQASISSSGKPGQPMNIASADNVVWSSERCKMPNIKGAEYGSDGSLIAYGNCGYDRSPDPKNASMLIVRLAPSASQTPGGSSAWIFDFGSAFPPSRCEPEDAPFSRCRGSLSISSSAANAGTIKADGTVLVVGRASIATGANMEGTAFWLSDFAVVTVPRRSCGFN